MDKVIDVDAFTLFEYMFNHQVDGMFTGSLLTACTELGITSHDHARARYTSQIKETGLASYRPKKGWMIQPSATKNVTVLSMDATVADLLQVEPDTEDAVVQQEPIVVKRPVPVDHGSYSGSELAGSIARELLSRLEAQAVALATPALPREEKVEDAESRASDMVTEFEEYIAQAEEKERQYKFRIEALDAELERREQALQQSTTAATALREQVSTTMREIADASSGEDIRLIAARFPGEGARS